MNYKYTIPYLKCIKIIVIIFDSQSYQLDIFVQFYSINEYKTWQIRQNQGQNK